MVDVISLRQAYKQQNMTELKQIQTHYNLVDSIEKSNPSSNLKTLIDINDMNIRIMEWVKWANIKQMSITIPTNFEKVASVGIQLAENTILEI